MAPKKFVSAQQLSETVIESTMKTMKIENRLPEMPPHTPAFSNGSLVQLLRSHTHSPLG